MKKIKIGDAEVALKGSVRGDVPVIFAVHGAGGGAWMWKDLRVELSQWIDLVAIDLPGHVSSTGKGAQSVEIYREIVREAARSMALNKPFAIGHSMGGAIVMDWAISHPEELAGIILVSTGAKLKVHPMVFESIAKDFEAYISMIKTMAFGSKVNEELLEFSEDAFSGVTADVTTGDFRACDAFNVMDSVGKITLPVLILCGSEDKMTPPKYSEFLAGKIPGATLKIFSGAGHMLPVERPENVADFVRRFIIR